MTTRWTGPWGDHRRYRVDAAAGHLDGATAGGEGLVFAARSERTGNLVALKMLTTIPVDDYGRVAHRAAVFADVEHPNLMRQVETFVGPPLLAEEPPDLRDFGIIYSVAEWVPGTDLDDAIASAGPRMGLEWVGQTAHAVSFLHKLRSELAPNGVVHRDIKPSNVRITPEERAVLIDFGVARPVEADDMTAGIGTHLWRAPEVVAGTGEPGPAADVWGVGALAYWALVGEPPALDGAATARERLAPAAREIGIPDPVGLSHHIGRLLELRPSKRPTDLDRWATELRAASRRSAARRLAKPVVAGTAALLATGLAAWGLAPRVAKLGRRDSAAHAAAETFMTKAQALAGTEPPLALAMATEARHREHDAETDAAVETAYDTFARSGIVATLRGHDDSVGDVAFSPDGHQLASASDDGTVRLWDPTSHRPLGPVLQLGNSSAAAIAYAPDGSIAVGADDGSVRLWPAGQSGDAMTVIPSGPGIESVAFSPDGTLLGVERRDIDVTVLRTADGTVQTTIPGAFQGMSFVDGGHLALGRAGSVELRDPTTGAPTAGGFDTGMAQITHLAAGGGGRTIAAGGADGSVVVHRADGGSRTFPAHKENVLDVAVSDDGTLLASAGADSTAKVWDIGTGKLLSTHVGHTGGVQAVAFAPDGTLLATGGNDSTVKLWRAVDGRDVGALPLPGKAARGVAYSGDDTMVAGADTSGNVVVADVATGHQRATFQADEKAVYDIAFSRDGHLLTADADGDVGVWDPATGEARGVLPGKQKTVWGLAFNKAGSMLASAGADGTVRLWSWPSRQPVGKPLEAGPDVVNAVAFSPDGRLVATVDKGGSVIVWNVQRGDKLWEHEVHAELTAVTFSPDGRFIVTGGDDEVVKVWGVDDGKVHQELPGHRDTVTSVAFTPLGDLLATGSDDRSLILWDTASWRPTGRYSPDTKRVLDLAFNADGTQLATGGGEGVVRLWPTHELVTPETSAAQICTDVHDHVTEGALRKALKAKPQVCTDLTH